MSKNYIFIEFLYEFKRSRRSILFNIFAILAILGLVVYQFTFLSRIDNFSSISHLFYFYMDWSAQALASAIPFKTAYYFNIIQLFMVVVFVTNDSRLSKLNAMKALQTRPQGNGEVAVGNFLGKLLAFTVVACLSFAVSIVINIVLYPGSFELSYYFFYWITLILPALVYFLGFSYLVTRFVRHEGLSMMVLLFLLGGGTWLGADFLHGIFDPCARHVPNMFSDFTGHVNLGNYLLQRGCILLSGVGFLVLSVIPYPRIPNRVRVNGRYLGLACVLFMLAGGLAFVHENRYRSMNNAREAYKQVYEEYGEEMGTRVVWHDLILKEKDNGDISVNSRMRVVNGASVAKPLVMYLNPGLKVTSIVVNGSTVSSRREYQALLIDKELKPGEACDVSIDYEGGIENGICFLDIDPGKYNAPGVNSLGIYYHGYAPAFCGKDYKLLSPECIWYPVCVPSYNLSGSRNVNFTRYSLRVEHDPRLTAISQGDAVKNGEGQTSFTFSHDMPGISLCIGNYKKRAITVDSTRVELYVLPGHEYLLEGYDFPEEPLAEQLSMTKQSLEMAESVQTSEYRIKSYEGEEIVDPLQQYPYRWFVLLEVPCNFHSFPSLMQLTGEREQGGLVFLPEKGYSMDYQYYVPRDEEEKLSRLNWIYGDIERMLGNGSCDIKPMFRGNTSFIFSGEYPVMNTVLSAMAREVFGMRSDPIDDYPVVEYLKDKSLRDALHDHYLSPSEVRNIIRKKSVELHKYIMLYTGEEQYRQFYHDFMASNLFKETTLDEYFRQFYWVFHVRLDSLVERWYNADRLPLFEVRDALAIKVGETDLSFMPDVVYSFKVFNRGDVPGLVMTGDYQGWIIPPHEGKEIKIRNRKDNTNISVPYLGMPMAQNLPASVALKKVDFENGIDTIACESRLDAPLDVPVEGEIIVDNEDPGFRVVKGDKFSLVSLLRGEESDKKYYKNFSQEKWLPAIDGDFYGSPVRSAYYKRAGTGDQKVEWSVRLPREGKYEVFFYNTCFSSFMTDTKGLELHYTIFDGREKHEVVASVNAGDTGWVSLGVYDFSQDASVTLSDKDRSKNKGEEEDMFSMPQSLVADAVKWVVK